MGAPSCSCDEYRHIACPDCGKYVCAGCGSFDPRLVVPEPVTSQGVPRHRDGTGFVPIPKEELDEIQEEVKAA